ncbi:MAG: CDP-alcohol phosphatidyltransferase family protein [Gammaproteobacteria bacterium]|nr:CDP-alcohol phosphatidyltransferase family protein [Gammaproteobacteria bacterium]
MSGIWIPNAICVLRIVLIAPLVAALLAGNHSLALLLIVIAGISDGVDGFLAKTFDWQTRLGSLLDPAADKLLLVCTFLTLTYLELVPLALTVIVILRDVIIVSGALVYQQTIGELRGEPTLISKLNTLCQLLFVIFVIMHASWQQPSESALLLLGAAVVFTSIASGLNYVLIWSKRARQMARSR